MWSVLLVEDEVFVRRKIRQMIRWEELGFTIAGEAGSGEEALEQMRKRLPDLVISDIVMPGLDGVGLLRQARAEGYECSFVMLTAMSEFEYARQALQYGASAYLLKLSMNVAMLEEMLVKVDRELRNSLQIRSQAAEEAFRKRYEVVWRELAGERTLSSQEKDRGSLTPIPETSYENVWVGSFLGGGEPVTLEDLAASGLVSFGCRSVVHWFPHSGQTSVFVWNPVKRSETGAGHDSWNGSEDLSKKSEERDRKGGQSACSGCCSPVVPASEWRSAWQQVLRRLDALWYGQPEDPVLPPLDRPGTGKANKGKSAHSEALSGGEMPLTASLPKADGADRVMRFGPAKAGLPSDPQLPEASVLTWRTEREWLEAFERRDASSFVRRVEESWRRMAEQRFPMAAVKAAAIQIDRQLARVAGMTADPEDELAFAASHAALKTAFLLRAQRYAEEWRRQPVMVTDHPDINRVLAYIREAYDKDITLKSAAAMIAMDETYLSGLFKKKTGETLIHYIQKLRVEQAKRYLATTTLPVADVGMRVGFPNANYFIKIFKRWSGQTPSDYRASSL